MTDAKTTVCSDAGSGVTFMWIEFLMPQDGIVFSSKSTKSKLHWKDLLACSDGKWSSSPSRLPLASSGSFVVNQWKKIENFTAFQTGYGSFQGTIGYASLYDTRRATVDLNFFGYPKIRVNKKEISPNIYILSGHGAGGKIYGEGRTRQGFHLFKIVPYEGLKILIIAACSQLNYSRATLLASLFNSNTVVCILGYCYTYSGGSKSGKVMEEFVNLLESGITILEAWKAANDKYHDPKLPISSFPWAAVFRKSAIAAVAADLEKDAQFSGSDLVYCSMFQPIIQPIEPLPYISYMFYSEKTSTEALIIEEINDFEKNNTACSTAHSLATGNSGETILVLRNTLAIGKTKIDQLRANDVFVYKFCVVRPDWECPLEISSVFVPRLGLPVTKALVQFPFGQDGDVMRVKITEDCDRCIILLSFLQKALEYLKKASFLGNHPYRAGQ
ncbi:MAG: hypothetical protein IPO40_17000 [Fibrobacteres bacterium]|nr:hypothetical protein [Fibrobacterota bacterium]